MLTRFNSNPPAAESAIKTFEEGAAFALPSDYREFLQRSNGGEGFVGPAYLILWRVEELQRLNLAYEVAEYAPGLVLFGSDGGGEAFAFDTRSTGTPIVSVPFVGMDLEEARPIATSFKAFLEALFSS